MSCNLYKGSLTASGFSDIENQPTEDGTMYLVDNGDGTCVMRIKKPGGTSTGWATFSDLTGNFPVNNDLGFASGILQTGFPLIRNTFTNSNGFLRSFQNNVHFNIGDNNTVTGNNSLTVGNNLTASNSRSIVSGQGNVGNGTTINVSGVNNTVDGNYSNVTGINNDTSGNANVVGGYQNDVSSTANLVVGGENDVSGIGESIVGGFGNTVSGFRNFISGTLNDDAGFANTTLVGSNLTAIRSNQLHATHIYTDPSQRIFPSVAAGAAGTLPGEFFYVSAAGGAQAVYRKT